MFYYKIKPNGLLIQWKIVSDNLEQYQNVQFPIDFSNTNFCVVASSLEPYNVFHIAIQNILSTNTIKLYHDYSKKYTIIAIGY